MLDILTRLTAKAKTYEHLIFWLLLAAVIKLGAAQTIPRLNLSLSVDEPFTANLISEQLWRHLRPAARRARCPFRAGRRHRHSERLVFR